MALLAAIGDGTATNRVGGSAGAAVALLSVELQGLADTLATKSTYWTLLTDGNTFAAVQMLAQGGAIWAKEALARGGNIFVAHNSTHYATRAEVARAAAPTNDFVRAAIEVLENTSSVTTSTDRASGVLGGVAKMGAWLDRLRVALSESPGQARSMVAISSSLVSAQHTLSATVIELSREPFPLLTGSCKRDKCAEWTDLPDWTLVSLNVTHLQRGAWALASSSSEDALLGWEVSVLSFELRASLSGRISCPAHLGDGSDHGVQVQMRQPGVSLRFYRFCSDSAPCSDDLDVSAVASRLGIDDLGFLKIMTGDSDTNHIWWHEHEPMQVRRDRLDPHAVCVHIRIVDGGVAQALLEFGPSLPLIVATATPSPLSIALGAVRSTSPLPFHIAPMLMCDVMCIVASQTPVQQLSVGVTWNISSNVPLELARCVDWLLGDYAVCGRAKKLSDAAFSRCVGGPSDHLAMPSWLVVVTSAAGAGRMQLAVRFNGKAMELHALETILSCALFTAVQRAACECSSSANVDLDRMLASRQGVQGIAASMRCLSGAVGANEDGLAHNWPADVTAVASRLRALGYIESRHTGTQLEHAVRTFLCAAAGVLAFEKPCDSEPGSCRVDQAPCTRPSERGTCLFHDLPCVRGLVEPGSGAHRWLRAVDAPGWTRLALESDGYAFIRSRGSHQARKIPHYGTTWLREALILAGRSIVARGTVPLEVIAAAGRDGGSVSGLPAQHQSGLQLQLSFSALSAVSHVSSLLWAGFDVAVVVPSSVWPIGCPGALPPEASYGAPCEPSSEASFVHIRATVTVRSTSTLPKVPLIQNASLHSGSAADEFR